MSKICIRKHNGAYPDKPIVYFCTNPKCQIKLMCDLCVQDYHRDHKILPVDHIDTYIQSVMDPHIDELLGESINEVHNWITQINRQLVKFEKQCNEKKNEFQSNGILKEALTEQFIKKLIGRQLQSQEYLEQQNQNISSLIKISQSIQYDLLHEEEIYLNLHKFLEENIDSEKQIIYYLNHKLEDDQIPAQYKDIRGQYTAGTDYLGEVKGHMRHGRGIYIQSGEIFDGVWKDNELIWGQKCFDWGGGIVIHQGGPFKDCELNGYGIAYFSDRPTYEGQFSEGSQNGLGTIKYANGSREVGQWHMGDQIGEHKYFDCDTPLTLRKYDSQGDQSISMKLTL